MLLKHLNQYSQGLPSWFEGLCDLLELKDQLSFENGVLTIKNYNQSEKQTHTATSFGYQWQKKSLFEMAETEKHVREWLLERFGKPQDYLIPKTADTPLVMLDAGCGAAMSALAYFGSKLLKEVHYIGVDISQAIYVAEKRFAEAKLSNKCFVHADLNTKFLKPETLDLIFSEGVLHHTDNPENSFYNLCYLLKSGGYFIFYIYKKKAPIREFTDDYIRNALSSLTPEEKYQKLFSLTKLGKTLGDLNLEINIEEPIDILNIPAGKMNLQRLFFYYIFKCFYKPSWNLEQMNLTNFDWYSPQNCSRHTTAEVRGWIENAKMTLVREYEDDSGLSYVIMRP